MAYRIIDLMAEYTNRETGARAIMAELAADTAADLPANTSDLEFILGSFARTIDTGGLYKINSAGVWVLQPSETISIDIPDYDQLEASVQQLDRAAAQLADDGSKNKLQNTAVSSGIFTVNSDGSVTAAVPADNAQASLILHTYPADVSFDHDMILSGCPSGGSYPYRWSIYLLDEQGNLVFSGGQGMADEGITRRVPAGTVFRQVRILIRAAVGAQTLTFYPMLCDADLYDLSQEYLPYAPSNADLYAADIAAAADIADLQQNRAIAGFTPETSAPVNSQRLKISVPRSNNTMTFLVGKLNSTTNYIQLYVNDIDKGYITFTVSRNIDTWQ